MFFRKLYDLGDLWPPSVQDILHFIAYLSLHEFTVKTAQLYVASVSYACKARMVSDPTCNFLVKKVLEGLTRKKLSKLNVRLPITNRVLELVISKLPVVCDNSFEAKLFSAAYVLAFCGFMLVGELTQTSEQSVENILSATDISMNDADHSMRINIRVSKTDQSGYGSRIKIKGTRDSLCPVRVVHDYLRVRPKVQGPLLLHFNNKPVTRYQFGAVLHKTLKLTGLNHTQYKTHSFRIGAATTAAALGYSDAEIKAAGRWKS